MGGRGDELAKTETGRASVTETAVRVEGGKN